MTEKRREGEFEKKEKSIAACRLEVQHVLRILMRQTTFRTSRRKIPNTEDPAS